MALQTSGAISINDIATEFGGTAPHSLSEYYVGGGLVPSGAGGSIPSSGQISLNDFYGSTSVTVTPGYLKTWASIKGGQAGNGQQVNTNTVPSSRITAYGGNIYYDVNTGKTSSAAASVGKYWVWGFNTLGEFGVGDTTSRYSPTLLTTSLQTGDRKFSLSMARSHGFIDTSNRLWMMGANAGTQSQQAGGALGDNTTTNRSSPVQTVAGGTNWSEIDSSGYYLLGDNITRGWFVGLKTDGRLWSWGSNEMGQLGDNTATTRSSPLQVVGSATTWARVSDRTTMATTTHAIKTDGRLWGWGQNGAGQIADNTTTSRSSPVQVFGSATNWESVSETNAIKTDGRMWGWGNAAVGGVGNSQTKYSSPVQVIGGGTTWAHVEAGIAVKTDGTLWGWGFNGAYARLNTPFTVGGSDSPVQLVSGTNFITVGCTGILCHSIES